MFLNGNLKSSFTKNYVFGLSLLALALIFASDLSAAQGNLDRTFGNRGRATGLAQGVEKAFDAVVQPDGKIVVAGGLMTDGAHWDTFLRRYNANGTPDSSFNNAGASGIIFSQYNDLANAVALQPDGGILVAGYMEFSDGSTTIMVARFLPNGILDQTFGNGGRAITGPATSNIGLAVAVQSVGGVNKIIVGGSSGSANPKFYVARFEMNGQPDSTFGTNGSSLISVGGFYDSFQDLTIDGQNRIVAVGSSRLDLGGGSYRDDFAAIRLLQNGALDPSFSNDGKVTTLMGGLAQPRSVAMQTIGTAEKIVVGGFTRVGSTDDFALLRYNADGAPDTTFDGDGKAFAAIAGDEQIQKVLVGANGKITAVGHTYVGGNRNFAAARFNLNGSLDTTFGACGKVVTDLGTNFDTAYGGALQTDGKIIAVGESIVAGSIAPFAVVRYTSGGQATATNADFDGDGREDFSVYRPSEGVWYANCTCQGFRAIKFGLANDVPVYGDFDGDGITDQAVYRGGAWYINRSLDGGVSYGNFGLPDDIPTVGDYDGDEKADLSVWRPSTGVWYVLRSSDNQYTATSFGLAGDKPVPADYDSDGKTDLAIYRNGDWWVKQSSDASGNFSFRHFGIDTDKPLTGDFDGDGRSDLNVYRASEGLWYQQSLATTKITRFGLSSDKPVPADFDGDGKTDIAIYRNGEWHVLSSSTNAYSVLKFGLADDIPTVVR